MQDENAGPDDTTLALRLTLAAAGAAAGLAFWLLFDVLPDAINQPRLLIFLAALAGGFFGGLLLLLGRLDPRKALICAAVLGLIPALLLFWAGFRFDTPKEFLNSGHAIAAYLVLVSIPLPFMLAHLSAPKGWLDYDALFDEAWTIFVRAATAWAFVGLFWLVIILGDALLKLVNFRLIGDLVKHAWFSLPLTGLILGLALAVLHEMATVVSTLRRLVLQLLRLLLPLVAVIVAVFIVLVPFQGLENVFRRLSAAATMLAMAMGAVTLITATVDARDADAAKSRLMVISAKVLAMLLPLVAGIATYAIWLRVIQYGWTPHRLAAAAAALIVLIYALGYAASVLTGGAWRARIRQANTAKAIAMIGLAALWLTPALNAERISANNQLARFEAGKTTVAQLDLWAIGREWGRAGEAVIEVLRSVKTDDRADLDQQLTKLDGARGKYAYRAQTAATKQGNMQDLKEILPVFPADQALPDGALAALSQYQSQTVLTSCRDLLPDGRPGCAAIIWQTQADDPAVAVVLFYRLSDRNVLNYWAITPSTASGNFGVGSLGASFAKFRGKSAEKLLADIQDSKFSVVPVTRNALDIDGSQIFPVD